MADGGARLLLDYVKLARPHQWAKGVFVAVGPVYALSGGGGLDWLAVVGGVVAFGLASSACYVVNDIQDREEDRHHPRKRRRPIARGAIGVGAASAYAALLLVLSGAVVAGLGWLKAGDIGAVGWDRALWLGVALAVYVANVSLYSLSLKHAAVLDVISLASGFVLRVLGGCAAAGVEPSSWLLNVTFFVSMFLAFGKRLGERRTMEMVGLSGAGEGAARVRGVHREYTDDLLRMAVVVTAVATLVTYSGYVQAQAEAYTRGFNLLWLTVLPATYGLLRCIVLLERGLYDDPTELAAKDRPFQAAALLFALLSIVLIVYVRGSAGVAGTLQQ